MGWSSANDIFDPVADALIRHGASDELKLEVLTILISTLQDGDWDTEQESLSEYEDDPVIVEAFRRNGIVVHCTHEGGPNGDWWCELERCHDSDHEDYLGRTWSKDG